MTAWLIFSAYTNEFKCPMGRKNGGPLYTHRQRCFVSPNHPWFVENLLNDTERSAAPLDTANN